MRSLPGTGASERNPIIVEGKGEQRRSRFKDNSDYRSPFLINQAGLAVPRSSKQMSSFVKRTLKVVDVKMFHCNSSQTLLGIITVGISSIPERMGKT